MKAVQGCWNSGVPRSGAFPRGEKRRRGPGPRTRVLGALALGLWLGLVPAAGAQAAPQAPESARGAGGADGPDRTDFRAELTLLLDASQARPGDVVRVGVLFEMDPHWHIYWRNPGDSGLPTALAWETDAGPVGGIRWPAPERFDEAGIRTYGYDESVLLMGDLQLREDLAPGDVEVAVTADFLVCRRLCIPGRVELSRPLRIGPATQPAEDETRALFAETAAALPVAAEELGLQLEALYSQSAIRPADAFRAGIAVLSAEGSGVRPGRPGLDAFIPDAVPQLNVATTGTRPHPTQAQGFLVTLEGEALAVEPERLEERLRGVLAVRTEQGLRHVEVDLPLARAPQGAEVAALSQEWLTPLSSGAGGGSLSLLRALLLALAGGLILNLMPCVLPVLAIKVVRVAELAHERRSAVWAQGAAYTAGILGSMLLLAALVVLLRSAGTSVGWGFQFQEPRFLVAICAVLVLFALNLFGVFEIDAPAAPGAGTLLSTGGPLRRSFFEGLLAVVLATPCTAPFLGTAVGFAFAGEAFHVAAIFAAIGVGLAAPFVIVTLVPGWSRFLPRPGPWMLQLRALLGFALLATVIWMFWLLSGVTSAGTLVGVVSLLTALGFVAWVFGLSQGAGRRIWAHAAGLALVLSAAGGVLALPIASLRTGTGPGAIAEAKFEGQQPFAPAAVRAELAAGRPVFVYFTADWCLTCKVNERFVLDSEPVRQAVAQLGVSTFKADWTQRDETIRAELERHGRAGVPMYLVYRPEFPEAPQVLPELLTEENLVAALRWAAQAEAAADRRTSPRSSAARSS